MTVHGAKGLEAPIVFLPDTCSVQSGRMPGSLLPLPGMQRPGSKAVPFAWPLKGASRLPAIAAASAVREAAEQEERNRLLYVAMTRARDCLYICGYEGKQGRKPRCWYDILHEALQAMSTPAQAVDGRDVLRLATPQTAEPDKPRQELAGLPPAVTLPEWAGRAVPREPQLAVPLAPSRLAPYDIDGEGEPRSHEAAVRAAAAARDEPAAASPVAAAGQRARGDHDEARFLRGTLTHALLEYLPGFERASRRAAAEAFVASRGAALAHGVRASIVAETLRILDDDAFADLFGPAGRAEVPIIATLPRPAGKRGPPLKLTGQIDRLVVRDGEVLIIDYKTNRLAPQVVADVAETYLLQVSAYRLALQQIYPGHTVRAALLWTEVPRIMDIPPEILDAHESRLWELDAGRLDG